MIFGITKFHQFLYGRKFTLVTDHKPLTTLLNPTRGVPALAAARMQRWALSLTAYSYNIEFRRTQEHSNADGLSRLPLPIQPPANPEFTYTIGQIQALPVTSESLVRASRQDPTIAKVIHYVQKGWPTNTADDFKPYRNRYQELTIEGSCLMWGSRVVIPQKLRDVVLEELHRNHPGITRMKALARSYLWWPGLDKALEECARNCIACQSVPNAPAVAPLHPWVWPAKPWQHIHVDFAGPFQGHTFLIIVDAHSKWPEVVPMVSTSAQQTITELRRVFATYGLPEQLVSDNGPQFVAAEFETCMKSNEVKHIRCAPYHPSLNGLAERFVQTFKKAMKANINDFKVISHRLAEFLLSYRNTPHATTNQTPSELLMGRKLRTRLDLLRPAIGEGVLRQQAQQKGAHDQHCSNRELHIGQQVMARNFRQGLLGFLALSLNG